MSKRTNTTLTTTTSTKPSSSTQINLNKPARMALDRAMSQFPLCQLIDSMITISYYLKILYDVGIPPTENLYDIIFASPNSPNLDLQTFRNYVIAYPSLEVEIVNYKFNKQYYTGILYNAYDKIKKIHPLSNKQVLKLIDEYDKKRPSSILKQFAKKNFSYTNSNDKSKSEAPIHIRRFLPLYTEYSKSFKKAHYKKEEEDEKEREDEEEKEEDEMIDLINVDEDKASANTGITEDTVIKNIEVEKESPNKTKRSLGEVYKGTSENEPKSSDPSVPLEDHIKKKYRGSTRDIKEPQNQEHQEHQEQIGHNYTSPSYVDSNINLSTNSNSNSIELQFFNNVHRTMNNNIELSMYHQKQFIKRKFDTVYREFDTVHREFDNIYRRLDRLEEIIKSQNDLIKQQNNMIAKHFSIPTSPDKH
ncbi:hypothetical protein DLAC_06855 [Tieghemostelium lacteum]|uniref:Uncharacterized protein n=1 Tax=Tieghemostelium lacteum TaxID=361077 RepID=A0A151ZDJ3_TIELA|nr:hypothetical protein DLAC_06855 [Tieghemostelium lacteum]|eukprot:KYQ92026.1 hypothetical protein DLAC_06855 [Tieghemostelium lacteum]